MIGHANFAGRIFYFGIDTLIKCVTPKFYVSEIIKPTYTIGVKSLLLTSIAAISVGMVMAMQTIGTLETFGAANYEQSRLIDEANRRYRQGL